MARTRTGSKAGRGGIRDAGSDALRLVVDYVKQETLEPLKGLGRFILFGVVGSVAFGIGLVILTVAFLRLLQTETGSTFGGHLSWVPYLICTAAVLLAAAAAVLGIYRGQARRAPAPGKEHR